MDELKLSVKKLPRESKGQCELQVEAPEAVSEKAYRLSLRDVTEKVEIPGFRKGKAPRNVVEQKVGVGYISQKAFELVFYDLLSAAAMQEKLDIIDVVEISSFELLPGKPLQFKAVVELKPEVKLGKYKGFKIKATKYVYDKEQFVSKTLEKISNNLITFRKVNDRNVKEGDLVVLDFEGKFTDGTEVPGGKVENFQALLEKDKFLPDFVNKLAGVKIGETNEIVVDFPDNYAGEFSGKKANFKVTVKSIEEKVVPEINDELAKKVGIENLGQLKQKVETQMIEMQELNSQRELENKIVDQVVQDSKYDIPPGMISKEIDFLLRDVKSQCEKNKISWSDFKTDEKNKDILANAKEAAIKRIAVDLVLTAIAKNENISATEEETKAEVNKRIAQLGDKFKQLVNDRLFLNSVEFGIVRNKSIDFLLKNNETVWEKEVKTIPGE